MKKILLMILMLVAISMMTGCTAVDEALGKIGDDIEARALDTPQSTDKSMDWSFVPVVREMATETFMAGFPEATIIESSVASKNGASDRVIVTLTYQMGDKKGEYGFDYEKNDQGEYELVRYGDGVNSDDL